MPEQQNANGTETGTEGGNNGDQQQQTPPQEVVKDAAYWQAEAEKNHAEAEKWKGLSRDNESKWKKATKPESAEPAPKDSESTPDPLEAYRTERVRDKARDKFEVFADAVGADLNAVMKHVTIESFLDEDGTSVLTDEIKAYVENFAPKKGSKFAQGVGVGPQGGSAPSIDQRIAEAQKAGDTLAVITLKRELALSKSGK